MKVLVINCSPVRNGATAEIVKIVTDCLKKRHNVKNICRAIPNWNGCDYCDVYAGSGIECWKQGNKHNCCHCERVNVNEE